MSGTVEGPVPVPVCEAAASSATPIPNQPQARSQLTNKHIIGQRQHEVDDNNGRSKPKPQAPQTSSMAGQGESVN
eukprot:scaffold6563_cov131-Isochrysis_galbana.AAC.1